MCSRFRTALMRRAGNVMVTPLQPKLAHDDIVSIRCAQARLRQLARLGKCKLNGVPFPVSLTQYRGINPLIG
jgi:hypothetical protein